MNSLVVMALSNAVVAALMAVVVIAISRVCRRPALTHGLWLLVLLKLITPPVFEVPVRVSWWNAPPPAAEVTRTDPSVAEFARIPNRPAAPSESLRNPLRATGPREVPLPVLADNRPVRPSNAEDSTPMFGKLKPLPDGGVGVSLPEEDSWKRESAMKQIADRVQSAGRDNGKPVEANDAAQPLAASAKPATEPVRSGIRKKRPGSGVEKSKLRRGAARQFIVAGRRNFEFSTPDPLRSATRDWGRAVPALLGIWLAGSLFWALIAALRVVYFRHLIRQSQPAPNSLKMQVRDLTEQLRMSQVPEVRLLPGTFSPMLWAGGRKPLLLFPRELLGRMDDDARSTLLLHELAHMRRGDHWVRYVELLTFCLYWWNPVVWLARREIHRAEEECCDALVVKNAKGGGRLYATALLDTLDFLADARGATGGRAASATPPLASGIGHVAFIRHRLKKILAGSVAGELSTPSRVAVLALAVVLLPMLPTFARQQADAQPKPSAKKDAATTSVQNDESSGGNAKSAVVSPNIGTGEPTDFETTSTPLQFDPLESRSLDVTKDGRWLASAHGRWTTKGRVRVWNLKTMKEVSVFDEPKGIASVVFSPDDKLLATAGWDRVLRIREMPSLKEVHAIQLDSVARLAFSPDGKTLASATESQKLQFWDPRTGKAKKGLEGTFFRMQYVAYSADGRYLAVGGGKFDNPQNGRVAVWDLKTGKQFPVIENIGQPIIGVAFSPDGRTLVAGGFDRVLRAWSLPDLKLLYTASGHTQGIERLAYSPDGKTIATASFDRTVRVWDAASGESLAVLSHTLDVYSLVFAQDGKTLFTGGADKLIRLWDPATYRQTATLQPGAEALEIPEAVLFVAASSDGKYFASSHEDKTVRLRDAATGQVLRTLRGHGDVVSHVGFSPDGKYLSTASFDKTVKLWSVGDGKELFTLTGHTNWVFSAAFSPDGNLLATSGYDKTIRLWYARTGKPVATLEGHAATVRSVAFSPDGKRLVSGSGDRTLKIWDVKTRKELHTLKGHKGTIREVAYSPDGQSIASASEDQTVIIWNGEDGKLQRTLSGHAGMVWALAFSPQGKSLASGGFDNAIIIWDPQTGARRTTLRGHTDVVTSLAFAAETRGLITGSYDKSIRFWKAKQAPLRELLAISIAPNGARAVEFSPDGRLLAAAAHDGIARVWDTLTGKLRHVLRGHSGGIRTIDFSPDGNLMATGSWDHSIQIWDTNTGKSVRRLAKNDDKHDVMSARFFPDGKRLASGGRDGTVRIWNVDSGSLEKTFDKQSLPITGVDVSPDGRYLLAGTGDYKQPNVPGTVLLWDLRTSKRLFNFTGNREVRFVRFSHDGRHFAASGAQTGGVLTIRETRTGNVTSTPFQTGYAAKFAFLPDGKSLVANRGGKIIALVDWRTGKELATFTGHEKPIYHIAASPDGSLFASVSEDGTLKLWPTRRTPPLKSTLTIPVTKKDATRFAIPLPGGRLVTGGHDKLVKVWDRKTGNLLKTLAGHPGGITCGDLSSDGRLLATGSWDKSVRLWDLESMQPTATVLKHSAEVVEVKFTADGRRVVTAGRFNRIQIWDVKTGKLIGQTAEQDKPIATFDISPDRKLIAGAVSDWTKPREPARIQLWSFPGLKPLGMLHRHRYELKTVDFSSDGGRLLVGGTDLLVIVDVQKQRPILYLRTETGIMRAAFFDGDRFITSGDWLGRTRVWNARSGQLLSTGSEHDKYILDLTVDRKTGEILTCGTDGTVKLWAAPGRGAALADRVRNWEAVRPLPSVSVAGTRLLVEQPNEQIYFGVASPEFQYFAAGGESGEVTLYDTARMAVVSKMKGHTGKLWSAAFSPDSKLLATGGNDKTLRIWNVPGGALRTTAEGHESRINSVAFTPDGKQIVSVDGLGYIRVWEAASGKSVAVFRKEQSALTVLAVSPDGKLLAVGGWAKDVDIWRLADRRLLGTLTGHTSRILSLTFSPDGRALISGDASTNKEDALKVWNVGTRTLKYSVKEKLNNVIALAFSRDGQTFVAAGGDTNLRFWDLRSGRLMLTAPTSQGSDVRSIAWSSDVGRMITTGVRGTAKTWYLGSGGPLWMTGYATEQPLAATLVLDRVVAEHKPGAWFATYSTDGKLLATGGEDKRAVVWDAKSFQERFRVESHKGPVVYGTFSPDGTLLATSASTGEIHLTTIETGKFLRSFPSSSLETRHKLPVRKLAFTPDGKRLLSVCNDGSARIFDTATGKTLHTLSHATQALALAVSPDGKTAAVGTGDWNAKKPGLITLWNLQSGKRIRELPEASGYVTSLVFLTNGRLLAARAGHSGAATWDVKTGRRLSTLRWPDDVRLARLSRDGKKAVLAYGDGKQGNVGIWNLESGRNLSRLRVSDGFLFAAEFSPDGKSVVTAAKDGSVKRWTLRPNAAAQVARP
jgi:WD40 repeat protein/beta-lactamase regulating signal transducer with metallopeptidase domain